MPGVRIAGRRTGSFWVSCTFDDAYRGGHHTIAYHICSHDPVKAFRTIDVYAAPDEVAQLAEDGFLVRERLFSREQTTTLRSALDEVAERELDAGAGVSTGRRFGGLFLRHLMDKHPVFLELFRWQTGLSLARAVLGPQVQVRPMTGRISYPDQPNQETEWHLHQRVVPDPMPPFFTRPHVIDTLIYLDDADDANGPLLVVPGTHQRIHDELSHDTYGDLPGQITLRPPAGSCIFIHGALWHRALPTTPQGTVRRLLILPYAAAWLKLPTYGVRPESGLMRQLYEEADHETLELLGEPEGLY